MYDDNESDDGGDRYDVVVVGGGAAGLSGALTLARARRSVLVIDAGQPRNGPADGVHGFLSRDGVEPAQLTAVGRAEVVGYGGRLVRGEVGEVARTASGFTVTTTDGRVVTARRLLVTTGLVDELPVPGLRERWGRDVLHCPYCHGWEVGDQVIGVLGTGPMAVHQAQLFRQWSPDVTLLVHTGPEPSDVEVEQLTARGIAIVRSRVEALEVADDALRGVRLVDGKVVPVQALVVGPRFVARSALLAGLGLEPTPHPMGAELGEYVAGDATGRAAPGVWVAGNVADLSAWVMAAASAGVRAGAAINADLIEEEVEDAVAAWRVRSPGDDNVAFSGAAEAEVGQLVAGDRRHGL